MMRGSISFGACLVFGGSVLASPYAGSRLVKDSKGASLPTVDLGYVPSPLLLSLQITNTRSRYTISQATLNVSNTSIHPKNSKLECRRVGKKS